ncbi:MAG: fluoride efflux transporter CrcB [Rhodospirillaceae bacterium]|nr:fluoride efflux transporter CrcB [Rhodospirillaceae bacterium]
MAYLWVALGGAAGSVARYGVGQWSAMALGEGFPWGTLIVNVVGSFIIGVVTATSSASDLRLLLAVGFCGGFTTFSAFSIQTLSLIQSGAWANAALNVVGSVMLCLLAVALGFALGGAAK